MAWLLLGGSGWNDVWFGVSTGTRLGCNGTGSLTKTLIMHLTDLSPVLKSLIGGSSWSVSHMDNVEPAAWSILTMCSCH